MSLGGFPVIYGIKPLEDSTEQIHNLGSLGVAPDGRKYRYAQAASTQIAAGKICIAADITANHEDIDVNTFSVGDKTITVTLGGTAVFGNEYEEGYVNVTDGTGEGYIYAIEKCPAQSDTTGDVIITLRDLIVVAAVGATTVTLIRNPYRDVVISDGTVADLPVGVTASVLASDSFGWLQTGGIASIVVDSSDTTAGTPITIGDTTAGGAETRNAVGETYIGIQPSGANADAGEHGVYYLTLD